MNSHEHTLLICTVGGTPDPLVKSLLHWQPARAIFVPSQQTRSQVDAVLRAYAEHARQPLSPGCYRISAMDDAENLYGCLQVIRALDDEVQDWLKRGDDYQVVADFTAGTKCMSAALALHARRWQCRFSYVGGARRTKEGVGVVEAGSERVVYSANPWDALGFQVVEDAVTVFNHGGYAAAADLLERAMKRIESLTVKRELATLKAVLDGYAAWDRFNHEAARTRFDDALKNRNDLAAIFADAQSLIDRIERHRESVAQLSDKNESTERITDLVCNARRRATERRYDDAVARLYRAFEALAQIRLRDSHGISDTKFAPVDRLPDSLRAEWTDRARDGAVFLGLRDAYRLLKGLGDDLGARFSDLGLGDDRGSPLVARNQSILAHGFRSVSEGTYIQLYEKLCQLAVFEDSAFDDYWSLPAPR